MTNHLSFEDLAVRKEPGVVSPEKLSTLKRVFDTICQEAAIPVGAKDERDALAHKLKLTSSLPEVPQRRTTHCCWYSLAML